HTVRGSDWLPGPVTGPGHEPRHGCREAHVQHTTHPETSSTTTAVVVRERLFSRDEELALTGFLAGYSGLTRDAYTLDLRQYATWCTEHQIALFGARRVDIERFGRHLETRGRARATIARRLGTVAGFYRYA